MDAWVGPGMIDAILVLVAVEAIAVRHWLARHGAAHRTSVALAVLASGAGLLLAARAALAGDHGLVALALLASGVAHAVSLWLGAREAIDASRAGASTEAVRA